MSDTSSTDSSTDTSSSTTGGDSSTSEDQKSTWTPPASQADLDRIIEGRLARERDKYKGYDDLKAKAQQWDQLEESKKTPDQKAIDDAKSQATSEVTAKYQRRLVTTEVKALATAMRFNDPADALTVLDPEQLPLKDDEPDSDAIKKLLEKLAETKPYLLAADSNPRPPRSRPKPPAGDRQQDTSQQQNGRGRAAAALRQLGAQRGR